MDKERILTIPGIQEKEKSQLHDELLLLPERRVYLHAEHRGHLGTYRIQLLLYLLETNFLDELQANLERQCFICVILQVLKLLRKF